MHRRPYCVAGQLREMLKELPKPSQHLRGSKKVSKSTPKETHESSTRFWRSGCFITVGRLGRDLVVPVIVAMEGLRAEAEREATDEGVRDLLGSK